MQAYNDWHIDEWCGAYPARFIPLAIPPIWDAEACADEVRRVAKKGVHALTFTENPAALGYPSFHTDHWDPFWKAWCDTDTVMNMHIGSSGQLAITAPDAPIDVMITLQPMNIVQAAADLLWSADQGVPRPEDRAVRGRDRLDPLLPRARRPHLRDAHGVDASDFGDKLPERGVPRALPDLLHQTTRSASSCATRSASTTSAGRPTTRTATRSGPTRPRSSTRCAGQNDVPDDEINKMTHENAMRWYSLRPVHAHPPRAGHRRRAAQGRRGPRRVHPGARPRQGQPRRLVLRGFRGQRESPERQQGLTPASRRRTHLIRRRDRVILRSTVRGDLHWEKRSHQWLE